MFTEEALTGYGLTYCKDTLADDISVEKVKSWLTDSSRKANNYDTVAVAEDGIYVVVFLSKETKDSKDYYTYALKKCDLTEAPDTYRETEFKKDLIQSVLVKLELAEGEEIYKSGDKPADNEASEDKKELITAGAAIVGDMNAEVSTALSVKNDKYKAESLKDGKDERDDYLQWMFGTEEGDNKADPAATGDTKVIEKTEGSDDDKKTTYTFYVLVDAMKLDDDTAIWGGYLKFKGDEEARKKSAEEAMQKLYKDGVQLTGVELWRALQKLGATVNYGFKSSDLTSMTALSDWLFADGRSNSTMAIVSGKEKQKSSSSSASSTTTEIDVTYLAVLIEQTECWKATAFSGCITEQRNDWLEACRKGYDLNYDLIEKITETDAKS